MREIVASHAFCTEAKVTKGEAYLRDTTVHIYIQICVHIPSIWLSTTLALDLFTLFWRPTSFIATSTTYTKI